MSPTSFQTAPPRANSYSIIIYNFWKNTTIIVKIMDGGGFEPPKRDATDLQSAPFGHSGTSPYGAGDGTRTRDLLITNQLLYQLSYTSISKRKIYYSTKSYACQHFFLFFSKKFKEAILCRKETLR